MSHSSESHNVNLLLHSIFFVSTMQCKSTRFPCFGHATRSGDAEVIAPTLAGHVFKHKKKLQMTQRFSMIALDNIFKIHDRRRII